MSLRRCSLVSSQAVTSHSANPLIAVSGVLSSWLTVERKSERSRSTSRSRFVASRSRW
jgi:hypothetical protein